MLLPTTTWTNGRSKCESHNMKFAVIKDNATMQEILEFLQTQTLLKVYKRIGSLITIMLQSRRIFTGCRFSGASIFRDL